MRNGEWEYLKMDGNEYLLNIPPVMNASGRIGRLGMRPCVLGTRLRICRRGEGRAVPTLGRRQP